MNYKNIFIAILLATIPVIATSSEEQVLITAHTDVVYLANKSYVQNLPHWKVEGGEPPLSPHQAVHLAANALSSTARQFAELSIASSGEYDIWFYMVSFWDNSSFKQAVVLFDGHVILGEKVSEEEFYKIWRNKGRASNKELKFDARKARAS